MWKSSGSIASDSWAGQAHVLADPVAVGVHLDRGGAAAGLVLVDQARHVGDDRLVVGGELVVVDQHVAAAGAGEARVPSGEPGVALAALECGLAGPRTIV